MNKYLIIFIAITLGLVLVSGIIYVYVYKPSRYEFTDTLNVTRPEGGGNNNNDEQTINQYVSVIASGNISNRTINCRGNSPCYANSGLIYLKNQDPNNSHNCSITTDLGGISEVTYIGASDNVMIPANGNISFNIEYGAHNTGTYYVKTIIECK